ncbi:hypothetical protein BJX61DRAFT_495176 [Aspergillus egyptiacus]|nr:hypothetical protein BJX61DRAFT_495176 [Aspergillus egyptiacus]
MTPLKTSTDIGTDAPVDEKATLSRQSQQPLLAQPHPFSTSSSTPSPTTTTIKMELITGPASTSKTSTSTSTSASTSTSTPTPKLDLKLPAPFLTEKHHGSETSTLITPIPEHSPGISRISTPTSPSQPEPVTDFDPSINAKPYSPFYRHATPSSKQCGGASRFSHSHSHSRSHSHSQRKRSRSIVGSPIDDADGGRGSVFQRLYEEEDVEAQNTNQANHTDPITNTSSHAHSASKANLWVKERSFWDCLGGLSKGQKLAVKGVIAVLIVGCMVAVAVGITAAVGGGVWSDGGQREVHFT